MFQDDDHLFDFQRYLKKLRKLKEVIVVWNDELNGCVIDLNV